MGRSFAAALALALAAPVALLPASSRGSERTLPMRFDLRLEGPAKDCGARCRLFIDASGAITADTPERFRQFADAHDLSGATVVLDSDGGSVHGAIALGREIRRLGLNTTVGRLDDIDALHHGTPRAKYAPRAECESMCAFVLIAGVKRTVPPQARVMVHQIWLGDRREDPTAASYSAEDLVLVQRDIGRLVRYTNDMGASMELVDLALRIPPWEPMHIMTRAEIRGARVETGAPTATGTAAAVSAPPLLQLRPKMTSGVAATPVSEQRWAMIDHEGSAVLARRHPLTVEGESIGSFDLMVSCGADGGNYDVSYVERRHSGYDKPLPRRLSAIAMTAGGGVARLKVVSSERHTRLDELVTHAAGTISAETIEAFAGVGNHSMIVTTRSAGVTTAIRLGNTGALQNLPRLAASCGKGVGARADLAPRKVHSLASAK
jgi:hypothetical protein